MSEDFNAEQMARGLFQGMRAASLGTLSEQGAPFVSLVTAAPCGGHVVLLLSGLAIHSKNLKRDPRCSLLLAAADAQQDDPLAAPRLTLVGKTIQLGRGEDQAERQAFLDRHSSAEMYADFGDFAFYRVEIDSVHLVAGFGRIVKLRPEIFT